MKARPKRLSKRALPTEAIEPDRRGPQAQLPLRVDHFHDRRLYYAAAFDGTLLHVDRCTGGCKIDGVVTGDIMRDIAELVEGYHRFLGNRYPQEAKLYRALAEGGQAPKTMIIACCDSRADPSAIFSASPGQLFIVRNVANLVPPHEPHGDYHGTSAALEYAVEGLKVENILVMGHARCGGIEAFLTGLFEPTEQPGFIGRWMSLLNPARTDALREVGSESKERQQEAMEHAAIRHSLENLMTFPCVKERIADGSLHLHGAYFDISDGRLLSLDRESGKFLPVV